LRQKAGTKIAVSTELYKAIVDVVDMRMNEIRVHREDFDDLKSLVKNLTSSQNEFTKAQARTEKELKNLARQPGRLSERLGGSPEDLSYDVLPGCLENIIRLKSTSWAGIISPSMVSLLKSKFSEKA